MRTAGYLAAIVLVGIVVGAGYLVPLAGPGIAICAALAAALAVWLFMSPAAEAARKEVAGLRQELEVATQATNRLKALERNVTSLRHDLRGILSPALLTADRLLENENPALRRVAEVVIRTVDRATHRLAETKLGATESANKAAPLERPDPVD
jgi:uncharacterized protein HemX